MSPRTQYRGKPLFIFQVLPTRLRFLDGFFSKQIRDRISDDVFYPLLKPNSISPEKMTLYGKMWWVGVDTWGLT